MRQPAPPALPDTMAGQAARPPLGALGSVNNHALPQNGEKQADWQPNGEELEELRDWLAARPHGGHPSRPLRLEILRPDDSQLGPKAKSLMERDGFVVISDVLSPDELESMRLATKRAIETIIANKRVRRGKLGNRGSFRFSFGSAFMMGLIDPPASLGWHVLVDPPAVTTALTAIFESADYVLTGLAGDFCMPGCNQYQQIHDDMRGFGRDLKKCPFVVVNYPMVDFTKMNGPMRVLPGTMHAKKQYVPLSEEPADMLYSTLVGCPAGAAILRDPRIWHGTLPTPPPPPVYTTSNYHAVTECRVCTDVYVCCGLSLPVRFPRNSPSLSPAPTVFPSSLEPLRFRLVRLNYLRIRWHTKRLRRYPRDPQRTISSPVVRWRRRAFRPC